MPLVVNGVIIPETEASKLFINGVDSPDMFVNGVQVYDQATFSRTWSGSTYYTADNLFGMNTSGALARARFSWGDGPWATVLADGTWATTESYVLFFGTWSGYWYSGGEIRIYNSTAGLSPTGVHFTIAGGFTGTAVQGNVSFQTSGGQLRLVGSEHSGAWITLT